MTALSTPVQAAHRSPANVRDVALDPELARALRRLAVRADKAMSERDQGILNASRVGASLREIEAATGINYVTVRRIIERTDPELRAKAEEQRARMNAIKRDHEGRLRGDGRLAGDA